MLYRFSGVFKAPNKCPTISSIQINLGFVRKKYLFPISRRPISILLGECNFVQSILLRKNNHVVENFATLLHTIKMDVLVVVILGFVFV